MQSWNTTHMETEIGDIEVYFRDEVIHIGMRRLWFSNSNELEDEQEYSEEVEERLSFIQCWVVVRTLYVRKRSLLWIRWLILSQGKENEQMRHQRTRRLRQQHEQGILMWRFETIEVKRVAIVTLTVNSGGGSGAGLFSDI